MIKVIWGRSFNVSTLSMGEGFSLFRDFWKSYVLDIGREGSK